MRVEFLGSGDAFGSGGRFNTCFHVEADGAHFLIDCGATALPAMKRAGTDRNGIKFILLTHFHADHCGGVPPFVLDAQFLARRTEPLIIAGPPGLADWYQRAMELAFPGSAAAKRKFDVRLVELEAGEEKTIEGVRLTPFPVRHGTPEGAFFGYRIECEGRVLAYSGDSEWTDSLIEIGRDADLFICECYLFDSQAPLHLNYATLKQNLPRIGARRVMLTHMSDQMLARAGEVPEEKAHDGLVVRL